MDLAINIFEYYFKILLTVEGESNMKISPIHIILFIPVLGMLCGSASAKPFAISADGEEVTDLHTGLIWRHCAEGLSDRDCSTGAPITYTHEEALAHAKTVAINTGVAWRLPNIKELGSINDLNFNKPSIDYAIFHRTPQNDPKTLQNNFWSATPRIGIVANAWSIDFADGYIINSNRSTKNYIRLVRSSQ